MNTGTPQVRKLGPKTASISAHSSDPTALLAAIDAFIKSCRTPVLLEYGEDSVRLTPGEYSLDMRGGRLWIEVWSGTRSISRRILTVDGRGPGVLDCSVYRFGGKTHKLSFLDLDRPQAAHRSHSGMRQSFAEQFRRMLFRQFPAWHVATLSCGLDLQRSFSSVYPRASLTRGNQQIAALACPSTHEEPALLTFALLWLDYLRLHSRPGTQTSLALFLPDTAGNLTAHRLRWLSASSLNARIFRFNGHGSAGEVDPCDLGNLDTRLRATPCHTGHVACSVPQASAPADSSERFLEMLVRSNPSAIDASLLPNPIQGQVLTFAAGDRDLIDLLAISPSGRLTVLELKTSEDIHLPLQALDYWMRIRWHAQRGELQPLFPTIPLAEAPPRLLLVAPAMSFHSSNACILRYFSPEIEVERVGINSDWQMNLKVVLRLTGADAPISHGVFK
jgi:hypothetical protein